MADPAPKGTRKAGLKLAVELGPVLLFFIVYSKLGIFAATGVFMVTSPLALGYSWATERKLPLMGLVTTGVVIVFGTLTLVLKDERFAKLKPTVINGLFGTALVVGELLDKRFVKHLLGSAISLTDRGWQLLTRWWIAYFFGVAALNEIVWRTLSTDAWVNFKTFGLLGLTFLFFFCCLGPIVAKHELADGEQPAPKAQPDE